MLSKFNQRTKHKKKEAIRRSLQFAMLALLLASFVQSTSACIGRLAGNEQSRIFVLLESDENLNWSIIAKNGGQAFYNTPKEVNQPLEFSNDQTAAWSRAMDECTGVKYNSTSTLTLDFERVEPQTALGQDQDLMASGVTRPDSNSIGWSAVNLEIGFEQIGTWIIHVSQTDEKRENQRLFSFEMVIVPPCQLRTTSHQDHAYIWPTVKRQVWAEAIPAEDWTSKSTSHSFTEAQCA